jgi:hypothetical protein
LTKRGDGQAAWGCFVGLFVWALGGFVVTLPFALTGPSFTTSWVRFIWWAALALYSVAFLVAWDRFTRWLNEFTERGKVLEARRRKEARALDERQVAEMDRKRAQREREREQRK